MRAPLGDTTLRSAIFGSASRKKTATRTDDAARHAAAQCAGVAIAVIGETSSACWPAGA
jgi:precorrin isomerase